MALEDRKLWAEGRRTKPQKYAVAATAPVRSTDHGELVTAPLTRTQLCDEGSYFCATNPTPGTGIIGIAAADGYDATEALLSIHNDSTASEDVRIYLDYLEIACTVVDASGTDVRYDMHIDSIDRYTSGGSSITPVNANMASSVSSEATVKFGALVTAAASAARYLKGRLVSSTDLVANDSMRFEFGREGGNHGQMLSSAEHATLNTHINESCPPVVLGPGDSFLFTVNCSSQAVTGATWSFNIGWWER